MFGARRGKYREKNNRAGLASVLEAINTSPVKHGQVIDAITELRSILRTNSVSLTLSEKLGIVKRINQAKLRAFRDGGKDDYSAFRTLDSLSGEVIRLL